MFRIEIANRQRVRKLDRARLRDAVRRVLEGEGLTQGTISLAIVDDPTIHDVNRRFLNHDYATDVISFAFERTEDGVDGEIVASVDTAIRTAAEMGGDADEELLLYLIHGALHLVGYDDHSDADRERMRERERHYLTSLAAAPPRASG